MIKFFRSLFAKLCENSTKSYLRYLVSEIGELNDKHSKLVVWIKNSQLITQTDFREIKEQLVGLQDKVNGLVTTLDNVQGAINKVKEDVEALGDLSSIATTVDELVDARDQARQAQEVAEARVVELLNELEASQEAKDEIQAAFDAAKVAFDAQTDTLNSIANSIDEAAEKAEGLATQVTEVDALIPEREAA